MKVSELITQLQSYIDDHGDVEYCTDYECVDCDDIHNARTVDLESNHDGKLVIKPRELWDD